MANKNFEIKNGLTVAGTERISSAGAFSGSLASSTTATTQAASDNTTKLASTAYVTTAISNLSDSAPAALNTLNEIAAALGDDANYASTTTAAIAAKLPLAGGTMTGNITLGDNNKAIFGAGEDATIFSDGTSGYMRGFIIQNKAGNKDVLTFADGGATSLYHNNVAKLATTSTGIDVTGTITGDALTIEPTTATGLSYGADGTNSYINFEANSVGASVQLYAGQSSGGYFSIGTKSSGGTLAEKMRIDASGNVGIGTTAKKNTYPARFITTSLSTPASEEACHILELVGNRTTNAGNQNGMIQFWNNTSTAAEVGRISSIQGTALNSGAFTFATYNAATYVEAMRIIQTGFIGIGETIPDRQLHVKSGTTNVVAKFESTDGIAAIEFTDSGGSAEIGNDGNDVVLFPAGAEKFRVNSSGNIIAQSATQNRIVLGSTGNSSNNTSNWMRGNAGYLQFNSASSGYNWEINGSNKMSMDASGNLTTEGITAVANGNYASGTPALIAKSTTNRGTVRIRSDGDNPAELFFDVNGGIKWDFSVRASTNNYDMLMYPSASPSNLTTVGNHVFRFTQTGHLGIGTSTAARSGLDVQGAITMENADTDLLTHSYSSYASRVNSGRLDITTGYSGTMPASRVFRFKYNAVSWKAFHGRITLSGTGGFSSYEFGGYWNNSGSCQIKEIQNGISTSAAFTTSGQAILISITLGQTVVHPCFSLEYNQSGGDGPPRMDRAEVFIQ